MKRYFPGELYEHEGEELVLGGGNYRVDWERLGITDDFDMSYSLEHARSGFRLEASVKYDYSGLEPEIEEAVIESNRDSFDGIDSELFQDIWDDVRSGSRIE